MKIIKSGTHEILTRKNSRPTKCPREKVWDTGNTHEKKIGTHEKKFETHEIPTEKILGPTKSRWHGDTRPTRSTMARDPRNFAHSFECLLRRDKFFYDSSEEHSITSYRII